MNQIGTPVPSTTSRIAIAVSTVGEVINTPSGLATDVPSVWNLSNVVGIVRINRTGSFGYNGEAVTVSMDSSSIEMPTLNRMVANVNRHKTYPHYYFRNKAKNENHQLPHGRSS